MPVNLSYSCERKNYFSVTADQTAVSGMHSSHLEAVAELLVVQAEFVLLQHDGHSRHGCIITELMHPSCLPPHLEHAFVQIYKEASCLQ